MDRKTGAAGAKCPSFVRASEKGNEGRFDARNEGGWGVTALVARHAASCSLQTRGVQREKPSSMSRSVSILLVRRAIPVDETRTKNKLEREARCTFVQPEMDAFSR